MDCRALLRRPTFALATCLLAAAVAACGNPTHTATGEVVAIAIDEKHVTITHDDIPGVMPAMTMRFAVTSPAVLAGIAPGMPVRFVLEQRRGNLIVRAITPTEDARRARPGIHDHTPHHGGVVTMIGLRHLEATASPDGRVRVYLTDAWRRPLSPEGWKGTATIDYPAGRQAIPLDPAADALEGLGPPLDGTSVTAHVRITKTGEPVMEMHPVLPLRADVTGAPAVPSGPCTAPDPAARGGSHLPRCILQFPASISALATTPDGALALIAVEGGGVTAWHMPGAKYAHGFSPVPSVAGPDGAQPHRDVVSVIAVSPDGRQAIIAIEGRLLRYATASGRLLRELPGPGGVVQNVGWSPDGTSLLVTAFYDTDAHLVNADDGTETRRLVVEREGTAVGFTPDGHSAVVGTGTGNLLLFTLYDNTPPRLLESVGPPLRELAVVGHRVVSSGRDGILHVVATRTGRSLATSEPGSPCYRLAVAPGKKVAACAGYDRTIRLYRIESAQLARELVWHGSAVTGLGWTGTTLISGDAGGNLALWDLGGLLDGS